MVSFSLIMALRKQRLFVILTDNNKIFCHLKAILMSVSEVKQVSSVLPKDISKQQQQK